MQVARHVCASRSNPDARFHFITCGIAPMINGQYPFSRECFMNSKITFVAVVLVAAVAWSLHSKYVRRGKTDLSSHLSISSAPSTPAAPKVMMPTVAVEPTAVMPVQHSQGSMKISHSKGSKYLMPVVPSGRMKTYAQAQVVNSPIKATQVK